MNVYDLSTERLGLYLKSDNCDDLMKDLFFRESLDTSSSAENNNKENEDEDALSGKKKDCELAKPSLKESHVLFLFPFQLSPIC